MNRARRATAPNPGSGVLAASPDLRVLRRHGREALHPQSPWRPPKGDGGQATGPDGPAQKDRQNKINTQE